MADTVYYAGWNAARGAATSAPYPERLEGVRSPAIGQNDDDDTRGAPPDLDPEDPTIGRWAAVVLEEDADAAREALAPLLKRRREDGIAFEGPSGTPGLVLMRRPASAGSDRWFRSLDEACAQSVPHYLLLLGGPDRFPFAIQEAFDRQFLVGRLDVGDTPTGPLSWPAVQRYAQKLALFQGDFSQGSTRALVYSFATDEATRQSHAGLAEPLMANLGASRCDALLGREATTANLIARLQGPCPPLVYTASHGLEMPSDPALWGALTDSTFTGASGGQAFSALVLPSQGPFGKDSVLVSFACFSGGVPEVSAHRKLTGEGEEPLAGAPMVAPLARALLARSEGPVAFVGHVDRATSASFSSRLTQSGADPFIHLAGWYARGQGTLGQAVGTLRDRANQSARELAEVLSKSGTASRRTVDAWLRYNDCSGYVLLGDPVLRLSRPPRA